MDELDNYAPFHSLEVNRPGYAEDTAELLSDLRYKQEELRAIRGHGGADVGGARLPGYLAEPEWMRIERDAFENLDPAEQDAMIDQMHLHRMKVNAIQSAVGEWHDENLQRAVHNQPIRPMFDADAPSESETDDESDSAAGPEPAEYNLDAYIADQARRRRRHRGTAKHRRSTAKRRRGTAKRRRGTAKRRRDTAKRRCSACKKRRRTKRVTRRTKGRR